MKKISHGAGVFFPSADGPRRERALRPGRKITIEQNRVAGYRKAWKKNGLTQMALWLPSEIAGKLRTKSASSGKSISALAAEILSKGL